MAGSDNLFGGPQNDPISQCRLGLCSVSVTSTLVVVEVSGEIDISNVAEFDSCLRAAAAAVEPGGRLVVDLAAVGFLGVCGVRSVVRAEHLATARGGALQLVIASELVRVPLQALGVLERLQVFSSRSETA